MDIKEEKLFQCSKCKALVKWNKEYFRRRDNKESLKGITPTLNQDNTPHWCKKHKKYNPKIEKEWEEKINEYIEKNKLQFIMKNKVYLSSFISDIFSKKEIDYIFLKEIDQSIIKIRPKNIIIKILQKKGLLIKGKKRKYIIDKQDWNKNKYTQKKLI